MRIRWGVWTVAGLALATLVGCESRETADQREQRLTQRIDRMQVDMDGRMQGLVYKVDTIQVAPAAPAYAPVPTTTPAVSLAPSEPTAWELERIAAEARAAQLAASRPRATGSGGRNYASLTQKHIRVQASARDVQRALVEAGCNPGGVDGKIGPKTISAIQQFQRQNGLAADGIVGRRTWERLSAYMPASGGGYK